MKTNIYYQDYQLFTVSPNMLEKLFAYESHNLHFRLKTSIPKISINYNIKASEDSALFMSNYMLLNYMTNQLPSIVKAKQAIAAFNLKKFMRIGAKVTLRNQNAFNFIFKLNTLLLPRVRYYHVFMCLLRLLVVMIILLILLYEMVLFFLN
jgi:ribosomal protein L5